MMSSYNYEASCLYRLYTGCSNSNVRFRDQPLEMDDSVKGVVQFCDNGEWKTLCATNNWLKTFSSNAAPYVVCQQLGYSERGIIISSMLTVHVCMHIYRSYKKFNLFISIPTPSHFINPVCNGAERSLLECRRPVKEPSAPDFPVQEKIGRMVQ